MTKKIRAVGPDECRWAVNSLSNLGRLVGVTQRELDWIAGDSPDGASERAKDLVARIAEGGNGYLVTDLSRTQTFA
jgi:hypothetical protein